MSSTLVRDFEALLASNAALRAALEALLCAADQVADVRLEAPSQQARRALVPAERKD